MNHKINTFSVIFLFSIVLFFSIGISSAITITVGQHPSNDNVTDGTNDAVQINNAISAPAYLSKFS